MAARTVHLSIGVFSVCFINKPDKSISIGVNITIIDYGSIIYNLRNIYLISDSQNFQWVFPNRNAPFFQVIWEALFRWSSPLYLQHHLVNQLEDLSWREIISLWCVFRSWWLNKRWCQWIWVNLSDDFSEYWRYNRNLRVFLNSVSAHPKLGQLKFEKRKILQEIASLCKEGKQGMHGHVECLGGC